MIRQRCCGTIPAFCGFSLEASGWEGFHFECLHPPTMEPAGASFGFQFSWETFAGFILSRSTAHSAIRMEPCISPAMLSAAPLFCGRVATTAKPGLTRGAGPADATQRLHY